MFGGGNCIFADDPPPAKMDHRQRSSSIGTTAGLRAEPLPTNPPKLTLRGPERERQRETERDRAGRRDVNVKFHVIIEGVGTEESR